MFLQRHIPRVCRKKHKPTAQTNAADHLNTPRNIADDTNKTAWQWPYSAFGDNKPTGILKASTSPTNAVTQDQTTNAQLKATAPAFKFNLRFAGQYADEESNLNYNYFRNYQPNQGRYSQNDPIGLAGGWNMYAYVDGDPLSFIDPEGNTKRGGNPYGSPYGRPGGVVIGGKLPPLTPSSRQISRDKQLDLMRELQEEARKWPGNAEPFNEGCKLHCPNSSCPTSYGTDRTMGTTGCVLKCNPIMNAPKPRF
jgi:RHS repeat-associated protein